MLDFAATSPGVRSCVVAEQTLSGRTPAELVDYRRLEAAINLVFAGHDVDLLCPYDAGPLPAHLLDIAEHTHGVVLADGVLTPDARFDDPSGLLAGLAAVVPPPAGGHHPRLLVPGRRLECPPAGARHRGELGLDPAWSTTWRWPSPRCSPTPSCTASRPPSSTCTRRGTWVCHVQDGGRCQSTRSWDCCPRPAVRPRLRAVDGAAALRGRGRRHRLTGTHVRLHVHVPG